VGFESDIAAKEFHVNGVEGEGVGSREKGRKEGRKAEKERKIGIADWQTKLKFNFIRTGTRSARREDGGDGPSS
jgi:hypothetical protein